MTTEQLRKELKKRERETQKLLRDDMPRIIGRLAVNRFRDNFRQGGFVDQTLQAWPVTRRQQSGGPGAGAKYGPLLSSRNRLMNATQYTAAPYRVRIFNPEEYAAIHNNGGEITVTDKMRGYMWYKYLEVTGKLDDQKDQKKEKKAEQKKAPKKKPPQQKKQQKTAPKKKQPKKKAAKNPKKAEPVLSKEKAAEAEMWRRMALSLRKKTKLIIPQRKFLGQSAALLQQIKQKGHDQLKKRGIIP